MSYIKADEVLPQHIIKIIPKKKGSRSSWGEKTGARTELLRRNSLIYRDYVNGATVAVLAGRYYLSDKTIQRIIREMRINESV